MDFDKLIASVPLSIFSIEGLVTSCLVVRKLAACEARVSSTAKSASARVSQLLNLRNVVRNLPKLQEALSGCQSQLLRIIHNVCVHLITEALILKSFRS
jgi:hypothetical protein